MSTKERRWLIVYTVFLIVASAFLWQLQRKDIGRPLISDNDVISRFRHRRNEFEELVKMVFQDKFNGAIGVDFADGQRFSTERIREYRNLMRKCGIELLSAHANSESIIFWLEGQGLATSGRTKGINYYPKIPKVPIVDSLDQSCMEFERPGYSTCGAVRRIEDNWWIIRTEER